MRKPSSVPQGRGTEHARAHALPIRALVGTPRLSLIVLIRVVFIVFQDWETLLPSHGPPRAILTFTGGCAMLTPPAAFKMSIWFPGKMIDTGGRATLTAPTEAPPTSPGKIA